MAFDLLWLYRWPINWSLAHLPFIFRIHLWSILIFINLVWQHKVCVKWWFTRFTLCCICIQIGWYYKWTFIILSILYHGEPSFKSYDLLLIPWICFLHLANNFMQAHPHYISCRLFNIGIHSCFFKFNIRQGDPLSGTLFILAHFCVFHKCVVWSPHPWHKFLYSKCANGFYAICEILHCISISWGPSTP